MEYDTIYFDQFYLKCKDIVNLLEEGTETKGTFEKLVLILYEGLLHRDALILFMLGLYELNKKEVISKSFEEVWNNTFPKEMPSARDLLIQSAEVGLDQAKLWCAYCYSEGIFGFPQNYSQSDMLLNKIENRPFDDDIDYLRWLNDECKRTATIWDSSGREKTSDTYNSLHEISQQLSEFVSYCCEIPNGYGWSYYEWISKMNLYESCFDTEYAPPAILEREQNKEQADMLCADGKNAYKKKEYVKAKAFFLEAISYDKENPILYVNLCNAYIKLLEKENAIWSFTTIGNLGYPFGYSYAGRLYAPSIFSWPGSRDNNDYDRSLLFLRKALDLYTDPVDIGNHLYYIASVYLKRQMYDKVALYAHLSATYENSEGITLYKLVQERISKEAIQEVETVTSLQTLKQKDNLLETRGKPSLYPKALVYSFNYDNYLSQVMVKFSDPDQNAFQNLIANYADTEELERITEEIFYEGKPSRMIECEYSRIIIDLLTVKVCTNYFGCRTASETSTLSWLLFLKTYNCEITTLKQRKKSDITLSSLIEIEQKRRGVRQLQDLMYFYSPRRKY